MPGTKKRSIDIMETGENYGESNEKHENVHEFQIRNIMNLTFKILQPFLCYDLITRDDTYMKYQKIRIKSKDGINDIVEFVEQANYILYTITEVEQTHTKTE